MNEWRRPDGTIVDLDRVRRLAVARTRGLYSRSAVMDGDDLVQDALLGFMKASIRWRQEHGVALETFAYPRLRGEAVDALRRVNQTRRQGRVREISIDRPVRGEDAPLRETLADASDAEGELERADLMESFWRIADVMPEPHRTVISLLFRDGLTIKQVAMRIGRTRSQAQELKLEGLEWLRHRLRSAGVVG